MGQHKATTEQGSISILNQKVSEQQAKNCRSFPDLVQRCSALQYQVAICRLTTMRTSTATHPLPLVAMNYATCESPSPEAESSALQLCRHPIKET